MLLWLACHSSSPIPSEAPPPSPPLLAHIERRTAGAGDDAPIIVALHGLGDSPEGFQGLIADFPLPARFILPAGPHPRGDGHSWFPYPPRDDAHLAEELASSAEAVAQLIASLGPPVVVTGFSQGGMLSFALAAQHPEAISAAIPVSGTLPDTLWVDAPLPSAPVVTALHGDADERVPPEPAEDTVHALQAQGVDALFVPYPGVGHRISPEMRLDLFRSLADAIGNTLPQTQTCPLLTLATPDTAIDAPVMVAGAARQLPEGALLRPAPGRCANGLVSVEVLSINPLIQLPEPASIGDRGCMAREDVTPLTDHVLLPHPPMPGVVSAPADMILSEELVVPCGSNRYGRMSAAGLSQFRPATPEMHAAVEHVRSRWPAGLGPAPMVGVTAWGRVRLPLPLPLTDEEIVAEWARERLETLEQREKATSALGPIVDGEPLYTHFTGADVRYSDAWGQPAVVAELVALAAGWRPACLDAGGTPRTCTLQIGDLSWYNSRRPDPLGHIDHYRGTCIDLRLFRDDGSRYEAFWNQTDDRKEQTGGYSAQLTGAFLRYATQHHSLQDTFFNDPSLNVPGVSPLTGHDDHIHLCLSPG